MWPIILLLFGYSLAQNCDYSENSWYLGGGICINSKISTSATFSFEPLFPGDVKLIYAADDINGGEVVLLEPLLDINKVRDWDSTLVGWWLEYDEVSLNNTDLEMVTEMRLFFADVDGSVGGGVNGCEDLLGKKCTDQINRTLFDLNSELADYEYPLLSFSSYADRLNACPDGLLSGWSGLEPRIDTLNEVTTFNTMLLAKEASDSGDSFKTISLDEVLPSGNSSFTYARPLYEQRSLDEQTANSALAILMRYPLRDSSANSEIRNTTDSDINVALVCVQLSGGNEEGSEDQDDSADEDGGGSSEDAAVATGVPVALAVIIAAGLFALMV